MLYEISIGVLLISFGILCITLYERSKVSFWGLSGKLITGGIMAICLGLYLILKELL